MAMEEILHKIQDSDICYLVVCSLIVSSILGMATEILHAYGQEVKKDR